MGAQKNRLIETVLLSTHNICFSREIRKLIFVTLSYLKELGRKSNLTLNISVLTKLVIFFLSMYLILPPISENCKAIFIDVYFSHFTFVQHIYAGNHLN